MIDPLITKLIEGLHSQIGQAYNLIAEVAKTQTKIVEQLCEHLPTLPQGERDLLLKLSKKTEQDLTALQEIVAKSK